MHRRGRTLILGLGNPILGDDGVGIAIARKIREHLLHEPSIDFHNQDWGNPSNEHGDQVPAHAQRMAGGGQTPAASPAGDPQSGREAAGDPRAAVPAIDILEAGLAGRFLLDVICGYKTVIVADAIITNDKAPVGSIHILSVDDLGNVVNPYASHAIDLRTTVELGKQLGYEMPDSIRVYAVEIKENTIFREELSAEVEASVAPVARMIMEDLQNKEVS